MGFFKKQDKEDPAVSNLKKSIPGLSDKVVQLALNSLLTSSNNGPTDERRIDQRGWDVENKLTAIPGQGPTAAEPFKNMSEDFQKPRFDTSAEQIWPSAIQKYLSKSKQ